MIILKILKDKIYCVYNIFNCMNLFDDYKIDYVLIVEFIGCGNFR